MQFSLYNEIRWKLIQKCFFLTSEKPFLRKSRGNLSNQYDNFKTHMKQRVTDSKFQTVIAVLYFAIIFFYLHWALSLSQSTTGEPTTRTEAIWNLSMLKDQSSFFCKHELRSEASYEGSPLKSVEAARRNFCRLVSRSWPSPAPILRRSGDSIDGSAGHGSRPAAHLWFECSTAGEHTLLDSMPTISF